MYDAVVVGAGPAGAGAAYQLACRGLSVCLVEKGELAQAGPQWTNAVARWMFDRAGIPAPLEPERVPVRRRVMAVTPPQILDPEPVLHVTMPRFLARLHQLAVAAGVEVVDRCEIEELEHTGGRPLALYIRRYDAAGGGDRLAARLFVDATGLTGALRRRSPELSRDCPVVTRGDMCTAANFVYEVNDPVAARRFFESYGAEPGDRLNFVGVKSGYSTVGATLSVGVEELGLLTGGAASEESLTGEQMNQRFAAQHPWVGQRRRGGGGAIPIRRPYDRFAAPGLALVGNAACQVFPAHGSGVGPALVAGRILAETVSTFDDPGAEPATWRYQCAFMREIGSVLAAYDALRRMTQSLTGDESSAIFGLGLSTKTNTRAALTQHMPEPGLMDVARSLVNLRKAPRVAQKLLPTAMKMKLIHRHYRKYPSAPDRPWLARWSKSAAEFFGDEPDIVE